MVHTHTLLLHGLIHIGLIICTVRIVITAGTLLIHTADGGTTVGDTMAGDTTVSTQDTMEDITDTMETTTEDGDILMDMITTGDILIADTIITGVDMVDTTATTEIIRHTTKPIADRKELRALQMEPQCVE